MPDSPYSLRIQILTLLTVLVVSTPLFVSRSQLRHPLNPAELEVLLAAESLIADRDLQLEHSDQVRMSRQGFDILGPFAAREIRLSQPIYSVLAGPLAVWLGDGGLILANAIAFCLLLWTFCDPRSPEEGRFWWGLSYLIVCAYPVLVWRLDESVVLGAGLFLAMSPWGESRPRTSGVILGALIPGHLWLTPVALAVAWQRPWRFRAAGAVTAIALATVLAVADSKQPTPSAAEPAMGVPAHRTATGTGPAAPEGLAPAAENTAKMRLSAAAPELRAAAHTGELNWSHRSLGLAPWLAVSAPVLFLFGRIQGVVPYFFPWAVGFLGFLGYERQRKRLVLAAGLVTSLIWSAAREAGPTNGPAQAGLAMLLPAFYLFSRPMTQLSGLALTWAVSGLFTAVLFLNPIHSASYPADPLTLWPHRELPLELARLDSTVVAAARAPGGTVAFFPGRHAWAGPDGVIRVRGKHWGHLVLCWPEGGLAPRLLARSPVDLELSIEAGESVSQLELKQAVPVRMLVPESLAGTCGPARRGVEVQLRPSAGRVPRIQAGGGDGVDYVGLEIWVE